MYMLEETHFWFVGKRLFIKVLLNKYRDKIKNILDIGCGTGGTTKFLEGYGKVIGLEIDNYAIKFAKKRGVKVIKGNAERLPFASKSFDLVTILDVLYHKNVVSVKKVIQESYRVLKSGGYLLITDSAFDFLKSGHDKRMGGKRRFLISSLIKIIIDSRFEIIKKSYIFFFIFPLVLLKRKIIDFLIKNSSSDVYRINPCLNKLLVFLIYFEVFLIKYFSFPFGSSLIILARKN